MPQQNVCDEKLIIGKINYVWWLDTWITSGSSTIKIFRKARRKHFSISSLDLHTCESAPFCHGFLSGLSKQSKQLNRYWSEQTFEQQGYFCFLIISYKSYNCGNLLFWALTTFHTSKLYNKHWDKDYWYKQEFGLLSKI